MKRVAIPILVLFLSLVGLAQLNDLAISITGSPDPVMPGTSLIYEIAITNRSSEPAQGATITVSYDPWFRFRAATPAPDSGTTDQWTFGTIAPDERRVILVMGEVDPAASEKLHCSVYGQATTPSSGTLYGQAALDIHVMAIYPQIIYIHAGDTAPLNLAVASGRDLSQYTFAVLKQPQNGHLLGTPPNLEYVPKPGFVGTDEITYYARDPRGEKTLGSIWVVVLNPGEEMTMPGFGYTGELTFSGPSFTVENWVFKPTLFLHFPYFNQVMRGIWTLDSGFTDFSSDLSLKLRGDFPATWQMPITLSLKFDPTVPAFKSASLRAYTSISGFYLAGYFYLAGDEPQTKSYSTFQLRWRADNISLSSYTRFNTLSPSFGEERFSLSGRFSYDDVTARWGASLSFTKQTGFSQAAFSLQDIPIPCPLCQVFKLYLDLKATFSVSEKTIAPSLRLVSGFTGCVQPLVDLVTPDSGFGLDGAKLYGVKIRCELPGGERLLFATSFDPDPTHAYNCRVTGYCDFFENVRLEGPVFPCCGNPGWWDISLYFQPPEVAPEKLFGLALTRFNLWFPFTREFMWHLALDVGLVDPDDPSKTYVITFGWKGLW